MALHEYISATMELTTLGNHYVQHPWQSYVQHPWAVALHLLVALPLLDAVTLPAADAAADATAVVAVPPCLLVARGRTTVVTDAVARFEAAKPELIAVAGDYVTAAKYAHAQALRVIESGGAVINSCGIITAESKCFVELL